MRNPDAPPPRARRYHAGSMGRARKPSAGVVGTNVRRKEGLEKLTGKAVYVGDLDVPGALWGLTVRSTQAHAKIRTIRRKPGFDWKDVTVVTAADLPSLGCGNVVQLIVDDQPFLAEDVVRHKEEAVALVAAPTRERAEEAASHLEIEYEPLAPAFDPEGSDLVFKEYLIEKGDTAKAFEGADVVIEGTYRFGAQEQAYIENNGVVAWHDGATVTVRGSMQCPYYVHKALKRLFDLGSSQVRVAQTVTGGGFGGKEEFPSLLAGHASILAKATGKPVKLLYDRAEDMVATTKRHPGRVKHRTALSKDGRLLAMEIDVLLDGGAYATLSSVVLSRAVIHAAGPYRCDAVRIRGRVVRTHTPPNGAFRGFGVPQTCFACERHMDVIASKLKLDPIAFRKKNLLRDGETTATGQTVADANGVREALDRALEESQWKKRKKEHAAFNAKHVTKKRGIGVASFFHGTGFTGGGELYLQSEAGVALRPDGSIVVLAASTEIGQGTRTVFSQIVADTLGLPYAMVDVADPDTANVPDSGPTVASRTVAVVGRIVADAAKQCGEALAAHAGIDRATPWDETRFRETAKKWIAAGKDPRFIAKFSNPAKQEWDEKRYRGDAYGAYAWAAIVAEVEVDLLTFEVRLLDVTSAQEIGKAIHPMLAEGQIEGGTTQALGWALMEDVVMKDGRMANGQLTNYIIPTAIETPPMKIVTLERPYAHGPFGAKGIGELPMDGGAPAVLNAIADAIGLQLVRIPATPERIQAAWAAAGRTDAADELRDAAFATRPRAASRNLRRRA